MKGIRKGNKSGSHCYANGGRVESDISSAAGHPKVRGGIAGRADGGMVDGDPARARMDRAGKKPAATNVNIIVASGKPGGDAAAPPPPPMAAVPSPMPKPPMAPAMPPPAMGGAPMPPPAMGAMPMRASGGRVDGKPYKEGVGSSIRTLGSMVTRYAKGKQPVSSTQSEPSGPEGAGVRMRNREIRNSVTTPSVKPAAEKSAPERKNGGRVDGEPYKEGVRGKLATVGAMAKRAVQGKPFVSTTQSEPTCTTSGGCDVVGANRAMRGKFGGERKHGGRVMAKGEGAGGGLGRLDKIKDYGAKAGKPAKGDK